MKMAVCTSATPMLTPTRAETMAGVRTGESRSRRRIFFCRQVTRVSAAPNVAPVAIAQPSRPGVMYWIVFSDWSSTWATSTENLGGAQRVAFGQRREDGRRVPGGDGQRHLVVVDGRLGNEPADLVNGHDAALDGDAGGSSCRILPWSMMATRSQSVSASSR